MRISIDKPDGVTHADCELISQQVGTILDVEDVVPGHYTLEVSSPGVERKLLKPKDYKRFQGKKAKIGCASRSRTSVTCKGRWRAWKTAPFRSIRARAASSASLSTRWNGPI